ncbi:MAG: SigE family RNA polymerase sigma factor [Sporichthyaceae bacterium]|nr:SigE family RNA polymerase sigma factor [Sporichthyaceae bacterium]
MSPGAAGRLADFESFVAEQMSQLLGYAHALTGDRRHAEDLVQEALIRTGLAWHRVRRKDRPTAYVKTAILRLYLNERRRSSVPAAGYEVDNGAPDPGFTQVDEQDALKQALAKVPPKMRAVLVLRYLDGLPDDEIATALGCSRGTVRTQAARGLAKLRSAYLDGVTRHEA